MKAKIKRAERNDGIGKGGGYRTSAGASGGVAEAAVGAHVGAARAAAVLALESVRARALSSGFCASRRGDGRTSEK